MFSGQHIVHRFAKGFAAIEGQHIFLVAAHHVLHLRGNAQNLQGAGVAGEDVAFVVDQQQALLHVVGNHFQFFLLLHRLQQLFAYRLLLPADFGQQRRQFIIALVFLWIFQIELVERLDNFAGNAGRQKAHHQQNADHNANYRLDHALQHSRRGVLGAGNAQNIAVLQADSAVHHLLPEGVGAAGGLCVAILQRHLHLLPVQVVVHLGRVGIVVKQDRSIRRDQRHPLRIRRQIVQGLLAIFLH